MVDNDIDVVETSAEPRKRFRSNGDSRGSTPPRRSREDYQRLRLIGDMPIAELERALALLRAEASVQAPAQPQASAHPQVQPQLDPEALEALRGLVAAERRRKARVGETTRRFGRLVWWMADKAITVVLTAGLVFALLRHIPGALDGLL